ncbi:MAG: hypothetical protein F6K39_46955 [Okeania sp. SIO3B3]|nr:hypothetical protein [Okeania sp. SIO3B3]
MRYDFNSFVEVEWASWWNGHLGGMGILPVPDIFTPWQGQAGCLPPTYRKIVV